MREFTPIDTCLACGGDRLQNYAHFGNQPLANDFHRGAGGRDLFPLGLQVCLDCWHSMQLGVVDPERLYRDYPYASGTSASLNEYFRDFVGRVEEDFAEEPVTRLNVLEIASNDGSLLKQFKARGHMIMGVDPADNLVKVARAAEIPTVYGFWDSSVAAGLTSMGHAPFDVIVAMNVLGHVDRPLEFLKACKSVLAPGGRIYIQTSQARMLQNAEWDTVYHEHISFFTASSFLVLAGRAGLVVDEIRHVDVHGTSYLVELVDRTTQKGRDNFPIYIEEKLRGFYSEGIYRNFFHHVDMLIDHVRSTLALASREGYRLAGYGAAAKGMTFLNVAGIDLEFIVDDSPLKANTLCPGSNIPVVPAKHARMDDRRPIFWTVLAWNMRDEIVARIRKLRPDCGDRYMTYFPRLTVTTE